MTAERFPLAWPDGWARTRHRRSAQYQVEFARARDDLVRSLGLMGARSIILSMSVPLRQDGLPYATFSEPDDPGVAVYFTQHLNGKPVERVLACDVWSKVRWNLRALGHTVEAMRTMQRAGATQILDRAFSAFGELPSSSEAAPVRSWWEVLGFPEAMIGALSLTVVEARYRELAAKAHPDKGGSAAEMVELNLAREHARGYFGG